MTSISAVMPCSAQNSSISCVSRIPPIAEPAKVRRCGISAKTGTESGSGGGGRCADVDQRPVGPEQAQEPPHVERCADRVDDEVEAAGQFGERRVVAGGVVGVGSELQAVFLLAQRL